MKLRISWHAILLFLVITLAFSLRFYKLNSNPPGLYWDETVFGYDAYSILKTGKDHHGTFLPLFFESFGDWKLPVYHYLLVPSIAIFGLNEFAVRLPSALLGSLTVILFFLLVKKLSKNIILSLSCSLFLAISPWHIQFSRAGFETTIGLFFSVLGLYLVILGLEKNKILILIIAAISFVVSQYSYHAYRIFAPLLLISFAFIYLDMIKKNISRVIISAFISLILLLPLIVFTFSQEGRARAISQSAFKKTEVETARLDYDQKSKKPLRFLSKYLYNEAAYYSFISTKNYIEHFSPVFLFINGDSVGRHSQVDMGQLYFFEAILIVAGFLAIKHLKNQNYKIIFAWLLLAPISAIIVSPSPHAPRSLPMVIPLAFLSGLGAYYIFFLRKELIFKACLIVIIIYSHLTFLHLLFVHYPKKFAADWQDGYRQMVYEVQKYQSNFDKVFITNINQVPYIYVLFYQKYDPQKFIDQKGTRDSFDKYFFIGENEDLYNKGRILYVAPSWQKVDGQWIAGANDSTGRHIYSLWEIKEYD